MKFYKISQINQEYMLEQDGTLFNEDGDDVFSIQELTKYKVPLFRSAKDANDFLEKLETLTNRKFGRVPERNLLRELRYKDTYQEKEQAKRAFLEERNERWKRGEL